MKVLIIDGQGGGLGRQLVTVIKERYPQVEVMAVGTNSLATGAMLRIRRRQERIQSLSLLPGLM